MPANKRFYHQFLTALLLSSTLFCSSYLSADEQKEQKIYDVEIIVFKNISVPKGRELNLPTPSPTHTKQTIDMSNTDSIKLAGKNGFTALQQTELQLQDIVQRIIKSSRYQLLTHTGWRQPGLDKTKSLPVWIKGGQIFGSEYSSIDQFESGKEQDLPENPDSIEVSNRNELYELEGQITITLSRYLHTQAKLVLRKPANRQNLIERDENSSDINEIETLQGHRLLNYGLDEKRRMRSKRLHYLDHPQFGLLVLITPYEKPAEELSVNPKTGPS